MNYSINGIKYFVLFVFVSLTILLVFQLNQSYGQYIAVINSNPDSIEVCCKQQIIIFNSDSSSEVILDYNRNFGDTDSYTMSNPNQLLGSGRLNVACRSDATFRGSSIYDSLVRSINPTDTNDNCSNGHVYDRRVSRFKNHGGNSHEISMNYNNKLLEHARKKIIQPIYYYKKN